MTAPTPPAARPRVAIVAPYPRTQQAHGEESLGGVASYTKNLVDGLRVHADVTLLAPGDRPAGRRADGDVTIEDVPRRGLRLARALRRLSRDASVDTVHVQFEQHLFGGMLQNLLLALTLAMVSRRTRVVMTIHQVPDLDGVDRKFLRDNGLPAVPVLARAWLRTLYTLFALAAHRLVVHEPIMSDRLIARYGIAARKVCVIPHGVEVRALPCSQEEAKRRLGLSGKTVVFYFGYVTGYKGVDLLVGALESLQAQGAPHVRAVIAGKAPDRKLEKAGFRAAVTDLENRIAALSATVERKGFLSEDDIALHLAAADVVIFPYRQVFGASGPLSLAIGYGRPFLVSDAFRGMVAADGALFARDPEALRVKLSEFLQDQRFRHDLEATSLKLREEAAWPRIALRTAACYREVAA